MTDFILIALSDELFLIKLDTLSLHLLLIDLVYTNQLLPFPDLTHSLHFLNIFRTMLSLSVHTIDYIFIISRMDMFIIPVYIRIYQQLFCHQLLLLLWFIVLHL